MDVFGISMQGTRCVSKLLNYSPTSRLKHMLWILSVDMEFYLLSTHTLVDLTRS